MNVLKNSLIKLTTRLSLESNIINNKNVGRNLSTSNRLLFKTTPCLMAEPLKKKKRIDPAVVKQREERKKKKIEKQIRRLEKNARQLKPIEECEATLILKDERGKRQRPEVKISEQTQRQRALLLKQWASYKHEQHLQNFLMLDRIYFVQQKALDELEKESKELYEEAVQHDFFLLPFKREGPVETPAIDNYDTPDGEYQDVSKKWE